MVGVNGRSFWSARFHDFYAFLGRGATGSAFNMEKEPGFRLLKERPKWLLKLAENALFSLRDLPRGGYIEPLAWDESDFKEYLDEIDTWLTSEANAKVD